MDKKYRDYIFAISPSPTVTVPEYQVVIPQYSAIFTQVYFTNTFKIINHISLMKKIDFTQIIESVLI